MSDQTLSPAARLKLLEAIFMLEDFSVVEVCFGTGVSPKEANSELSKLASRSWLVTEQIHRHGLRRLGGASRGQRGASEVQTRYHLTTDPTLRAAFEAEGKRLIAEVEG